MVSSIRSAMLATLALRSGCPQVPFQAVLVQTHASVYATLPGIEGETAKKCCLSALADPSQELEHLSASLTGTASKRNEYLFVTGFIKTMTAKSVR